MSKFRDSIIGTVIILVLVCLAITGALASVNAATAPVIAESKLRRAEEARIEVLPLADAFSPIDIELKGLEKSYKANNESGFVFEVEDKGFGGKIKFMVGIDNKGNYTGVKILEHSETPGLGSKVAEVDYLANYKNISDASQVDGVTSATVTSLALKRAMSTAQNGYFLATGQAVDGVTGATSESTDATTEATTGSSKVENNDLSESADTTIEATTAATASTSDSSSSTESKKEG